MTRSNFRQADLQRIFRAANVIGAVVRIDLRTLVLTVLPAREEPEAIDPTSGFLPDGKEDWSDIE